MAAISYKNLKKKRDKAIEEASTKRRLRNIGVIQKVNRTGTEKPATVERNRVKAFNAIQNASRDTEIIEDHLAGIDIKTIGKNYMLNTSQVARIIREQLAIRAFVSEDIDSLRFTQYERLEKVQRVLQQNLKIHTEEYSFSFKNAVGVFLQEHIGSTPKEAAELTDTFMQDMKPYLSLHDARALAHIVTSIVAVSSRQAKLMGLDIQPDININYDVTKNILIQSVNYREDLKLVAPEEEKNEDESEYDIEIEATEVPT